MSVVEFFNNYWDWYLLVGGIFAISAWANDNNKSHGFDVHLFGSIVITFLWPTRLLSIIEQKLS